MIRTNAKIIENKFISSNGLKMILLAPKIAEIAKAGQFIEIDTAGATLLKKPISIADIDQNHGTITLYYKLIGKGTKALSNLKINSQIDIIGSLGNGFSLPTSAFYAVGGGIGIPPIYFLSKSTKQAGIALLGAKTAAEIILLEEFNQLKNITNVICTTDDGSFGKKGFIISELEEIFKKEKRIVYACGPFPLLKAVAEFCKTEAVECFVCMEAYMACGVGACMGCVIPTISGMQRVCKEGPVFNALDILWDEF